LEEALKEAKEPALQLHAEFDSKNGTVKTDPASGMPTAPPPTVTAGTIAIPKGMPARDGTGGKKGKMMAGRGGEAESRDADKAVDDLQKAPEDRAELFFAGDMEKRLAVRQLFRKLDPTQEWAENNYYKRLIQQQVADLVPVGEFWHDYAKLNRNGAYLSQNLATASRNFTEIMFALSVLDLPFEAGKHDVKFDGARMTFTPGSSLIAFHEEVREANNNLQIPILVSQNFYRNGDRFRDENGERFDKFITQEFVVHTVYGCQVVVTNPTSSRQKLNVLLQLPVGAREGVRQADGRFGEVPQGRLHRPARPLRLRFGQHAGTSSDRTFRGAGVER
jgi:hypothetical protein